MSCWRPSGLLVWVLSSSSTRPRYATPVSCKIKGGGGQLGAGVPSPVWGLSSPCCTHAGGAGCPGRIQPGAVEGEEAGSKAG